MSDKINNQTTEEIKVPKAVASRIKANNINVILVGTKNCFTTSRLKRSVDHYFDRCNKFGNVPIFWYKYKDFKQGTDATTVESITPDKVPCFVLIDEGRIKSKKYRTFEDLLTDIKVYRKLKSEYNEQIRKEKEEGTYREPESTGTPAHSHFETVFHSEVSTVPEK